VRLQRLATVSAQSLNRQVSHPPPANAASAIEAGTRWARRTAAHGLSNQCLTRIVRVRSNAEFRYFGRQVLLVESTKSRSVRGTVQSGPGRPSSVTWTRRTFQSDKVESVFDPEPGQERSNADLIFSAVLSRARGHLRSWLEHWELSDIRSGVLPCDFLFSVLVQRSSEEFDSLLSTRFHPRPAVDLF
jgi:hypothetical protein